LPRCLSFLFVFTLIAGTLVSVGFVPVEPVNASPGPDLYQSRPASHDTSGLSFTSGKPATNAYDTPDNSTYAEFAYESPATGSYLKVISFTKKAGPISRVDFRMKYSASAATKVGKYTIQFSITGTTWTNLTGPTGNAHSVPGIGYDTWDNQARPGGGSWTWTNIGNIQFRVVTTIKTASGSPAGAFQWYDAWVTVTYTPPTKPTVYLDPANTTDTTILPPGSSLTIRPNAEGSFGQWSYVGSSSRWKNWDEDSHNGDSDYNWIDSEDKYQTSNLGSPGTPAWSIAKVRVTVYAKANQSNTDDYLILTLVIGGTTKKDGVMISNVSTTYTKYTSTWGLNPVTNEQWTWAQIDTLEAGVGTAAGLDGIWGTDTNYDYIADLGLQIRVTQLYVEVFGPAVKFNLYIDSAVDLWQWQFEMWYNPGVLNGVFADEGMGYTVGVDPDGFLVSNSPPSLDIAGGPGWNNTMGKLWLTGASVQKAYAVTGLQKRLAVVMMEVVGKGETYLQLGSLTMVFNLTAYIEPFLGHSYFRNVAKASLPKPSFTKTPQIAPDPIEGYNVTFDASASTPDGGSISEYKWYLGADFPYDRVFAIITKTTATVSYNYTERTPAGGVYNVTLTVKDSDGIVASAKDSFIVKAHDIYVGSPLLWGVAQGWPATPAKWNVTVGETAKLNVTIENHGNYTESSIEVDCWYQAPGGAVTPITPVGTQTISSLSAVARVNVTFTWDTSGLTVVNVWYTVWANATIVPYEYRKTDNTGSTAGIRVKPAVIPEFPLGAPIEIALVVAIIYLWQRSRRRTKPYQTLPKTFLQTLKPA